MLTRLLGMRAGRRLGLMIGGRVLRRPVRLHWVRETELVRSLVARMMRLLRRHWVRETALVRSTILRLLLLRRGLLLLLLLLCIVLCTSTTSANTPLKRL